MERLEPLPGDYAGTRDALHRLASHVLAPARKAVTGRIGLRPTPGGFGTPPFGAGEGQQLRVEGASLIRRQGGSTEAADITSLSAAAAFAGVTLSNDPGIGHDPPPLDDPEAALTVEPASSAAVAAWFAFADGVLEELRAELKAQGQECSEVQLWPEHFDLACSVDSVNFGCSPGDGYSAEPYVYVGPWTMDGLDGEFWNAPFGAALPFQKLLTAEDQHESALGFLHRGADLVFTRAAPQP